MKLLLWGANERYERIKTSSELCIETHPFCCNIPQLFLLAHPNRELTAVWIASRREKPTKTWQTLALVRRCLAVYLWEHFWTSEFKTDFLLHGFIQFK